MYNRGNRAGIYLTVSIHLLVLILFLLYQIRVQLQRESAFVLDFTKQEAAEKVQQQALQQAQLRAQVSEELDAILSGSAAAAPRNVVVNATERGQQLRDDRYRNPAQVYSEHQQLQAKLDASRRAAQALQGSDDNVASVKTEPSPSETYKGPSVISYKLGERKALSLPIPVYKCFGGGDVTVIIAVDPKGYVVAASVYREFSSSDPCLTEYAVRAARSSRFSADPNAPMQQQGEIVYRFVAQ